MGANRKLENNGRVERRKELRMVCWPGENDGLNLETTKGGWRDPTKNPRINLKKYKVRQEGKREKGTIMSHQEGV